MSLQALATTLLLPPIGLLLGALVLLVWHGRAARLLAALLLVAMLAVSTPYVAGTLRVSLERTLPDTSARGEVGAIVVLSGDIAHTGDAIDLGPLTLERMRAGAALHRATGLPILVTGGVLSRRSSVPVAELMRAAYAQEFGITVRWVEPAARDTRDNAEHSAILLRDAGIGRVFVVTHAWHLPRALAAFERAGVVPVPAPVRRGPAPDGSIADWVPGPRAALETWYYLREWLGMLVYRLRDG